MTPADPPRRPPPSGEPGESAGPGPADGRPGAADGRPGAEAVPPGEPEGRPDPAEPTRDAAPDAGGPPPGPESAGTKPEPSRRRRFADLAQRTIWGLAVAVVAGVAVILGGWVLAGFAALVSALMAWEVRRMSAPGPFGAAGLLACLAGILACLVTQAAEWRWGILAAALALAAAAALVRREPAFNRLPFLAAAAYVALASSALVGLRADPLYGASAVVWVALSVVATDVGAYFVGRATGGPKLWPSISPGKTWSGLAGGVVAAAAVGAGFSAFTTGTLVHEVAGVSAVMAVVAQGGDLGESALKRRFGVKDSSRLIPGHGGLLDRLDGLLAAGLLAAVVTFMRGKSAFIW